MSESSSPNRDLRKTVENNLAPQAMRVLFDLLEGNKKNDPTHYFGTNSRSSTNARNLSRALADDYPDETKRFLDIRESEFTAKNIATNTAESFLLDKTDVDQDTVEAARDDFDIFLSLVYHQFFDTSSKELSSEYDALLAQATIFKNNNETVYYYEDHLPLDKLETRISGYVRKANNKNDRPRTARKFRSGDTAVLKLYKETSKTRQAVFKSRTEGTPQQGDPEITHQPKFNVRTMMLRAENLSDGSKITFSKDTGGWDNDLKLFLEHAFGINGGLGALNQRQLAGANQILDTAKEAAESDSNDDSDVVAGVEEAVSELAEETVAQMEDDDSISEEDTVAAKKRFESVQLQGVRVRNDGDTHIEDFVLRSQGGVHDTTDEVDEMEASLMALLAKADKENIRLIFRGTGTDGSNEQFEVYSGNWTTRSRGMPTEALAAYDSLFETTT
jgi:hypothetical protein